MDAGAFWTWQRDSGGMPCNGVGGNYECISNCVSQGETKNRSVVGDYDAGCGKGTGWIVVFLPPDRVMFLPAGCDVTVDAQKKAD